MPVDRPPRAEDLDRLTDSSQEAAALRALDFVLVPGAPDGQYMQWQVQGPRTVRVTYAAGIEETLTLEEARRRFKLGRLFVPQGLYVHEHYGTNRELQKWIQQRERGENNGDTPPY